MAGRKRISVVEDDASMRRALGRLLKAAGYACTEFASAEAILALEPFLAPDCLLCDIHLPRASGLMLVDNLRKRAPSLPVIFITGFDTPDLRLEVSRRGPEAFLVKPFEGRELLVELDRLLNAG
ncbi:MAG: response regulator [Alsobacter sp.]